MMRISSIAVLVPIMLAAAAAAPAAAAEGEQATANPSHAYTAIAEAKDTYLAQGDTVRSPSHAYAAIHDARDTYLAQRDTDPNPSHAYTAIHDAKDAYLAQSGQPGPSFGEPTVASGSVVSSAEGFHWDDAGLGAGVTLALVVLGGAGLVIRRRTALSPTAPTS